MTASESQPPIRDARDHLCLRIAGAGARKLGDAQAALQARLDAVLDDLAESLHLAHAPAGAPGPSKPARLTLLTGLADGADQCLAQALLRDTRVDWTEREHVAVLPFDADTYCAGSPVVAQENFDRLLSQSSTVIELDGRWLPDAPAEPAASFARQVRARAYRAQARLMLERTDLLLAVLDPTAKGSAGGTAETVRLALASRQPVLLLAFGGRHSQPCLHLLRRDTDWHALLLEDEPKTLVPEAEQAGKLAALVRELVPLPLALPAMPEASPLEGVWPWLLKHLQPVHPATPERLPPSSGPTQQPKPAVYFNQLRRPASTLNSRFSGRYRGGYLTNYFAAALATTLAAVSLALMVLGYKLWHDDGAPYPELKIVLIVLAFGKLGLVLLILWTTHTARAGFWNGWAVRTRYLAEHWRLMLWLPALGMLRPLRRSGEHHAEEHQGHESADALQRASVRNAPADTGLQPDPAGRPAYRRLDLPQAITDLQREWIATQHGYHVRTQAAMASVAHQLAEWVEALNMIVLTFVALDIILLVAGVVAHHYHQELPLPLELAKVALVMTAATLPAWVGALNGVRAQAEARRVSQRSGQLAATLAELYQDAERLRCSMRAQAGQPNDPGSWTLDALDLAERCGKLVAEDVAEWSVLYSNEVPDT